MTGIERLRRLASDMRDSGWQRMHDDLAEIADLIEREYGRSAETVRSDAMEAWRWVRKRGGLATLQLHEETFADMMRQRDEYRAIARDYERDATWVREHGGLSHVKDIYHDLRAVAERLGVEWSESELHGLMDALDRRLMPEGMERLVEAWPRFEDGEPVRIGGAIADGLGHAHEVSSVEVFDDAVALHWNPAEPEECVWVGRGERVRRPAVPAADGEPLEARQTMWRIDTGVEYWVKSGQTITADAVAIIRKTDCDCESEIVKASQLTHERPVADTWERLEDDATLPAATYCERMGIEVEEGFSFVEPMACDIVRRAKALAGGA